MSGPGTLQHYVPQQHLRRFVPHGQHKLAAYDKRIGRSRSIAPRSACASDGFYDLPVGVQGALSALVDERNTVREAIAVRARDKFARLSIGALDKALREDLHLRVEIGMAMVHQFLRTLAFRERCESLALVYPKMSPELFHHAVAHTLTKAIPQYKPLLLAMYPAFSFSGPEWTDDHYKCLSQCCTLLDHDQEHLLEHHLLNADWRVVHASTPVFFTSDNPVALVKEPNEGGGWGEPGNIVVWPMSPEMCLAARFEALYDDMPVRCGAIFEPHAEIVRALNDLQFQRSSRLVFGESKVALERHRVGAPDFASSWKALSEMFT